MSTLDHRWRTFLGPRGGLLFGQQSKKIPPFPLHFPVVHNFLSFCHSISPKRGAVFLFGPFFFCGPGVDFYSASSPPFFAISLSNPLKRGVVDFYFDPFWGFRGGLLFGHGTNKEGGPLLGGGLRWDNGSCLPLPIPRPRPPPTLPKESRFYGAWGSASACVYPPPDLY